MRNTSWTTQSKEGKSIATTRITSLHTGIGRSTGKAISDIIDYVENPEKTDNGRLISCYQCDSRVADAEFLFSKRQYQAKTGRRRGKDDVIAYAIRQSFVPGEITPEDANRLGGWGVSCPVTGTSSAWRLTRLSHKSPPAWKIC